MNGCSLETIATKRSEKQSVGMMCAIDQRFPWSFLRAIS